MLNDLIKVARRLDSFGLTKEARLLRSIIKSASGEEDLSGEGKFSDDAWDDGSTEPYYFKNTEGDEERAAKEKREWNLMLYGEEDPTPDKIAKREEERHNVSYYGTPEGHSAVRYNPHTGKYTNVWYTK